MSILLKTPFLHSFSYTFYGASLYVRLFSRRNYMFKVLIFSTANVSLLLLYKFIIYTKEKIIIMFVHNVQKVLTSKSIQ